MINISDPAKRKILGSKDSKNVILGRLLPIRSTEVMVGEILIDFQTKLFLNELVLCMWGLKFLF